jgi:hypothetical protein
MNTEFYAGNFLYTCPWDLFRCLVIISTHNKTINFGYISQFANLFLQKKFSDFLKRLLNNCGLNPIENSYYIVENKVEKRI